MPFSQRTPKYEDVSERNETSQDHAGRKEDGSSSDHQEISQLVTGLADLPPALSKSQRKNQKRRNRAHLKSQHVTFAVDETSTPASAKVSEDPSLSEPAHILPLKTYVAPDNQEQSVSQDPPQLSGQSIRSTPENQVPKFTIPGVRVRKSKIKASSYRLRANNASRRAFVLAAAEKANMSLASSSEASTPDLLGVPLAVRLRILGHVLIHDEPICPYYNAGSGEIPSSRLEEYKENFDASILVVSKQLYGEAAPLLYTGNSFTFWNPLIATWWMKRIRKNVGYLWALRFELNSGIDHHALFATWEVHWLYLFSWIVKEVPNLKDLYVSFEEWHDLEQDVELSDNWSLLTSALRCREKVVRHLSAIRGLNLLAIVRGEFLPLEKYREMVRVMRLPKEGNVQPQMETNEAARLVAEERQAVDEEFMAENEAWITESESE